MSPDFFPFYAISICFIFYFTFYFTFTYSASVCLSFSLFLSFSGITAVGQMWRQLLSGPSLAFPAAKDAFSSESR